MIRKNARLRREYLYRKNLATREIAVEERKKRLREAFDEGKPVPADIRKDFKRLKHLLDVDGEVEVAEGLDDEYRRSSVERPRIMLTTSRSPSTRLSQFAKEMKLVFPNCTRVNRGKSVLAELITEGRAHDYTDVVILHERRGEPDGLIVSHLPYGPTAFFGLHDVVLRHDIPDVGKMSEADPHLIFNLFTTRIGRRIQTILSHLFPQASAKSTRLLTFANTDDQISFRHHVYAESKGEVLLQEVGPRFEMTLYEIKLGTLDLDHAPVEWILRPHFNTAAKRKVL